MQQPNFRGLVEAAADVIAVFDREQRCVYANAALERATGVPVPVLLGKRSDEVVAPEDAPVWREAIEDVLRSGRQRAIECTIATPSGPRRFASVLARVPGGLVCAVSRDVTDMRSDRLLEIATRTMATGMVIVGAPAGDVLFKNDETERIFGRPSRAIHGISDYDAIMAFDEHGRRVPNERWPIARALAGESTAGELVEVHRHDGTRRMVSINATPVRDRDGRIIAAVSTYDDVTEAMEARRHAEEARDRTRRLQALTAALSGAVEHQQVVSILVEAGRDALGADGGFAWLLRDDATLELAACEHAGRPGRIDSFKVIPMTAPLPICDVVRSGQPMMFERLAAITAAYPESKLRPDGPFQAWAVIPFVVAGRGVGGVSFSFVGERAFSGDDRELLAAMMGQASLALERCMLLEAARHARDDAEAARQRERQLRVLAARLSSALTPPQVATIACEEVVSVLGACSAAASVRHGDAVEILGTGGSRDADSLARVAKVSLTTAVPIAEAVRRSEFVWCGSEAELAARYPHLEDVWRKLGIRSWGAVPFRFEGGTVGSLALSFTTERALGPEDREFLSGVGQLTAQALERARLYEAQKIGEEQLRVALTAGRAATWQFDVTTGIATRDLAYRTLLGMRDEHAVATDEAIHPDDREAVRSAFQRTLRDGTPFEAEARVRRDDGTYMWTRSHGRVMYDPDGAPRMLAGVIFDIDEAKQASLRADEERRINETLHRLGSSFASELDHDRLVRLITDEITRLVGAEVGAFFYGSGEVGSSALHTVSSGQVERYRHLQLTRPTPLLAETIVAHRAVRLDDVLADPRYGTSGGLPAGHPGVRSYLAVPVVAQSGEVFGSLLFSHPEVGRFTAAHERLAANIASQAAVALENARLYKAVREHKEQLELAVERARLADRRKDEFLAMLGHELRNPLAPIATALELMALKDQRAMHKERDVIRRQVEHLSRLIDDLLDVSRITRGKIQLARQVLELGAVLAKAVEIASPLLEKRMQHLVIDVPREGLPVDADPTRLAQVFQNLLINAAKYSEPRSQIVLRARGDADRVAVEVTDQGIGIPPDLMPRLFELFVQGDRALDRSQGGLGIGLTIAKSLCELHGGTIAAASAGLGHGSTFTVTLPRAVRAASPGPAHGGTPVARLATAVRVLVVDDNVDAAQTLHEFLDASGHESAVAYDGVAALELAGSFKPDIALLDIGLPVMDGYELARRLRERFGPERLRLIAVTGYGQETDRARSREAGFDHHLVKPIALETLAPLLASRS